MSTLTWRSGLTGMAHIVRSEKLPGSKVRPGRTESRWNKHTRRAKADSLSVFDKGEAGLACVQNILALTCIFVVSVGWLLFLPVMNVLWESPPNIHPASHFIWKLLNRHLWLELFDSLTFTLIFFLPFSLNSLRHFTMSEWRSNSLAVPVHKADPQHLLKAHYRSTITITSCCLPEVRADGLLFLSLIFFFLLKVLNLTLAWILSHP